MHKINEINYFDSGDKIMFKNGVEAIVIEFLYQNRFMTDVIEFYKVMYDGEEYYASSKGLNSKNPGIFNKVIAGIGYRGQIYNYPAQTRIYNVWKDMLYTVANPNNPVYNSYGGNGCYVDPRWLCFEMYFNDIIRSDSYKKFQKHRNDQFVMDLNNGCNCFSIRTSHLVPYKSSTMFKAFINKKEAERAGNFGYNPQYNTMAIAHDDPRVQPRQPPKLRTMCIIVQKDETKR